MEGPVVLCVLRGVGLYQVAAVTGCLEGGEAPLRNLSAATASADVVLSDRGGEEGDDQTMVLRVPRAVAAVVSSRGEGRGGLRFPSSATAAAAPPPPPAAAAAAAAAAPSDGGGGEGDDGDARAKSCSGGGLEGGGCHFAYFLVPWMLLLLPLLHRLTR